MNAKKKIPVKKEEGLHQSYFPCSVLAGQVIGEVILKPLYRYNLQPGYELQFGVLYIGGVLFFIFCIYYFILVIRNELE